VFVEALIAQATVELFNVGVLVRLTRLDQAQLHIASCTQATIALPQNSLPLCPKGRLRARCGSSWANRK
jgi:hypothetical protein